MKKYLHDFDRQLERQLALLESDQISPKNKETIRSFYNYKFSMGIGVPRLIRIIGTLRIAAVGIGKDFSEATRSDFERFVVSMRTRYASAQSIDTHINGIKNFYRWLNGGEYPECVKWMKESRKKSRKLPEDMLTQEEVKALLLNVKNRRDKALVSLLWESGARIGEIGGSLLA